MNVLACDIGGTRIKLGLAQTGRILARHGIPAEADKGLAAALNRIRVERDGLCRAAGICVEELGGVGLAFPGIIEPHTDRILSTPTGKFDDARTLDTHALVLQLLGLPVLICNDANAALAGEWQFGAARGCQSVVMMTLGTGVGSSAIIEGMPLRGSHGQAGCLGGHLLANANGRECACGAVGCVETEASTWVLPSQAQRHPGFRKSTLSRVPLVDYDAVFRFAGQGDALAMELRERSIRIWAAAAVSLVHAYDPEKLVLGGGIMNSGDVILPRIRDYVARHAWTPWGRVEVVPAALGNDAGLLGVGWLTEQLLLAT